MNEWFHKKNDESIVTEVPEVPEVPETPETPKTTEAPEIPEAPKATPVTTEEILKRLDAIQSDTGYLKEALAQIVQMDPQEAAIKISAIKDIVVSREDTNQQLLDFYQRLYRDQKPAPDMEWVGKISRGAEETARKAGRAARDWAGKTRDWFKDLSEENWDETVREQARKITGRQDTRSLREKVLSALRDPTVDEESRELILEYMDQLKSLDVEMQDQALDILTDPALETEEKSRILENLDEINQL